MAWELSAIATLNLTWWQQFQVVLITVAAIASLYLLSFLGVEGNNRNVILVGTIGVVSMGSACFISMVMTVVRAKNAHPETPNRGIEIFESVRSQRTFTTSAIDKDTIVFAVI